MLSGKFVQCTQLRQFSSFCDRCRKNPQPIILVPSNLARFHWMRCLWGKATARNRICCQNESGMRVVSIDVVALEQRRANGLN